MGKVIHRRKGNAELDRFKEQVIIGDRVKFRPAYTEGEAWVKGFIIEKHEHFVLIQADSGYLTAINYIEFIRDKNSLEAKIIYNW